MKQKRNLIIMTVLAVFFIILAAAVKSGLFAEINIFVSAKVQIFLNPTITEISLFIAKIGSWYTYALISILFLIINKTRKTFAPAALALALSIPLNRILKNIIAIERPSFNTIVQEAGYGFPSGHAMYTSAFIITLAASIYQNTQSKNKRLLIITFATLFLIFVGLSRIYLGVHTFTDIIAGYTIGIIIALFCTQDSIKKAINKICNYLDKLFHIKQKNNIN